MSGLAHKFRLDSTVAAIAIASATTIVATPASAQAPPAASGEEGEAIIITGSRIRRDPLDQEQPVVFVDRSDIERTGLTSAADVLQRLPGSGGALNSRFNNSGNFGNPPDGGGVGAGAAEADLRYLGSRRVLVLIDGLRYVNGASASGIPGSTDLNSIPDSMIDRIEVLQAGASSIYGSDAIAGVINIITRAQQDGLQASAQIGLFHQGDGTTQNYQLSYGLGGNDDRTRIVIGGNYVRQDAVSAGNRSISQFPTPGATSCLEGGCSGYVPLGRFTLDNNTDLTLRRAVLTGRPVFNPANPSDPASDFKDFTDADRFNFAPYNYFQIPLERYGGFITLTHEFSDVITLRLRGIYNHRESRNQAAPLPLGIGPDAGNGNLLDTAVVDVTNPYNPFGVTLDSSTYLSILRRVVEGGPRRYIQSVDTYYAAGTLDGSFSLFGNNWYWDVNGTWGRNDANQTVFGNVNAANVLQALGPVANCTAPCVPLNIFGGEGSITPAMYDYIAFTQRDSSRQSTWTASANVSGGLFDLPGGQAALAIGVEHRNLSGRFDPDPIVAAGLGSDIPALPSRGRYNVDEAYAELRLPFLANRPFFHRLEATGAVRFSDYSTSGSTTTFSAGVNWEPAEGFLLRGNWAEGFRAPSIGELFGTPSRFDQTLTDPCSDLNNSGASAEVRANCVAAGVPADGSYVQANPQLSVITGGNEDLQPETSESWGFGAVWRPSFLPRLSLEANYFNIRVDGAIQAIDANVLLSRCTETADPLSCDAITRTASGAIAQIGGILQNIAGIETDGIDFSVNYRSGQTGAGTFGLTWTASYLLNYTVTVPATDGVTEIDREGTEQGSPDQAFPRFKSTGIIDWTLGELGVSLTGRYISGVTESNPDANGNRMGSRFYTDLQIRWTLDEGFGFAIGANNLFNVDPPACFSCNLNNFDPTTYDIPGTVLYARATFRM